jgi:hypothetical protein
VKCPLCARSRHTTRSHPFDDCDVHACKRYIEQFLSGEPFRAGYHSRTIEGTIATMTQRADKGPNSGHGRIQYDAPRQCAYELHS